MQEYRSPLDKTRNHPVFCTPQAVWMHMHKSCISSACCEQKCHVPLFPLHFWGIVLAPGHPCSNESWEVRVCVCVLGFQQDFGSLLPCSVHCNFRGTETTQLHKLPLQTASSQPLLQQEDEFGLREPQEERIQRATPGTFCMEKYRNN